MLKCVYLRKSMKWREEIEPVGIIISMQTAICLLITGKLANLTFLRNPLDRYVSECLQLRRKGNWLN